VFGKKPEIKEGFCVFARKQNGDYNNIIFGVITGVDGNKIGVNGLEVNPVGLKNKLEQGDNKKIVCYVKDNGIGIPKEKQTNLFNRFYQVDSSLRRRHGGTGLGLSISKGIINGLGGKMWVESEPKKGSTFYFEVPKIGAGE